MAKKKQQPAVIGTPEDYTLLSWLGAEKWHQGGGEPAGTTTPEPHPNEVATRAAVTAGVYTADDVGLNDDTEESTN